MRSRTDAAPRSRRARAATRRSATVLVVSIVWSAAACSSDAPDVSDLTPDQRMGLEAAQHAGCASCHGASFSGGVGPTWRGLAGSQVELADGTTVVADDAYLTEAIRDPAARLVKGYTVAMPRNSLSDEEIALIVAYIDSLR